MVVEQSGKRSPLSPAYIFTASPHCLRLLAHWICNARALALASAGNNIAARMAMMAMTTSSSINVKPLAGGKPGFDLSEPPKFFFIKQNLSCKQGRPRLLSWPPPPKLPFTKTSRINHAIEHRAVRRADGHVDAVHRSGTRNVRPAQTESGGQRIRLHLQTPADVIRRPAQGQHIAGDGGRDVRRVRGHANNSEFGDQLRLEVCDLEGTQHAAVDVNFCDVADISITSALVVANAGDGGTERRARHAAIRCAVQPESRARRIDSHTNHAEA